MPRRCQSQVIALPTSVGYGAAEGGRAALSCALASCAPGVLVVNIDNGYGAACAALRVLRPAPVCNCEVAPQGPHRHAQRHFRILVARIAIGASGDEVPHGFLASRCNCLEQWVLYSVKLLPRMGAPRINQGEFTPAGPKIDAKKAFRA